MSNHQSFTKRTIRHVGRMFGDTVSMLSGSWTAVKFKLCYCAAPNIHSCERKGSPTLSSLSILCQNGIQSLSLEAILKFEALRDLIELLFIHTTEMLCPLFH